MLEIIQYIVIYHDMILSQLKKIYYEKKYVTAP